MLYTYGMNKKKTSPLEKRDALLAEMASLRGLLNGSLVQRYSTCSRKNCACHTGKRHGPRLYLANTLAALNILAFLTHTVLELVGPYQISIRERLGSRREYFLHLHVLTIYHLFQSWEDLEDFILKAHELGPYAPATPPELTKKGLIRRNAKRKNK